jgi:phosphate transporter
MADGCVLPGLCSSSIAISSGGVITSRGYSDFLAAAVLIHLSSSYDALKKLFPSTPLDPAYQSMQQYRESSSILPHHNSQASDKWATPEQFRHALDRERNKVAEFYRSKYEELRGTFERMEQEVAALEDRDLGPDDVIKEEDEDGIGEEAGCERAAENDPLLSPQNLSEPVRPAVQSRTSMFSRLNPAFSRNRRRKPGQHEADILEASMSGTRRSRSRSTSVGMDQSLSGSFHRDDRPGVSLSNGRVPGPKRVRRPSDMESSEDGAGTHDRRTSISSTSTHERDLVWSRQGMDSLGLVPMDSPAVPSLASKPPGGADEEQGNVEEDGSRPVLVWTANNDYGTVLRIGFKKRISAVWLEAYALKQYVDLNLTAFEKILKK